MVSLSRITRGSNQVHLDNGKCDLMWVRRPIKDGSSADVRKEIEMGFALVLKCYNIKPALSEICFSVCKIIDNNK